MTAVFAIVKENTYLNHGGKTDFGQNVFSLAIAFQPEINEVTFDKYSEDRIQRRQWVQASGVGRYF